MTEKSNPSVTESSLILNYNELQLVKPCFISTNASTSEAKTQAQTIARHVIKTKAPITVSSRLLRRTALDMEKLCTWPHFESEGFWNSEVAYSPQN